jgi:hypothetical protein
VTERLIRNADDLDLWITYLGDRKLPMTVSCVEGLDRSAEKNRLMWLWATEAGRELGESTDEIQRRWKLDFGVPVLCESSEEYRSFCRTALKRLTRDERMEAMRFVPVTSEMNVRQMVRFLDIVERDCLEKGVKLTNPDPDLAAYHARNRVKEAA